MNPVGSEVAGLPTKRYNHVILDTMLATFLSSASIRPPFRKRDASLVLASVVSMAEKVGAIPFSGRLSSSVLEFCKEC